MRTFGRRGGALLGLILTLVVSPRPAAAQTSTLPAGWAHRDIGTPAVAGSADSASGTFTVRGAGTDIAGTADQFHFAYLPLSGDVDLRVKVADLQRANVRSKAGLMIRESTAVDAKNGLVFVSGEGVFFQARSSANRKTVQIGAATGATPVWLRLVRQANVFTAYTSANGTAWTSLGSATIAMATAASGGLAVTSRDASQLATGTFSNLTMTVPSSLPSPWSSADIGSPTMAGTAAESSGQFTVKGSGQDIWDISDQHQFAYQAVTGDIQIVAWVASLQAPDTWSKAGLMIRESLTASAANASLLATGGNGWMFQRRLSAGGITYGTGGPTSSAPGWVKLVREGNLFSAYESQDGSQWTLIGTDTIVMPATVYVGFAVTSHTLTALAAATLNNVSIGAPTPANKPPTVSLSSPLSGASYIAPASFAISATAGDADGSVTRVDFYAGSQLVGSATASPFTVAVSGVAAGTYTFTAVATDNSGATASSAPVTVTVAAAIVPIPTKVVFVAPVDYDTNVTSCTVELRRATDAVTAVPVASGSLGKPAVVNGEISVDVSTLVDPLPTGSYYAVVVSVGPGGSTPSAPSAPFSK